MVAKRSSLSGFGTAGSRVSGACYALRGGTRILYYYLLSISLLSDCFIYILALKRIHIPLIVSISRSCVWRCAAQRTYVTRPLSRHASQDGKDLILLNYIEMPNHVLYYVKTLTNTTPVMEKQPAVDAMRQCWCRP